MKSLKTIAEILLKIGAVEFYFKNPATLVSGIKTPVYTDNRRIIFYPSGLRNIIGSFQRKILEDNLDFDVISGVEAGSIAYSSILGYVLDKPSVFVRKKTKKYGTKRPIEGGSVKGKKVLLVEDLISFGTSSLPAIEALREAGAIVNDCLIIVSYGLKETTENFKKARVKIHALASFSDILKEALAQSKVSLKEKRIIKNWLIDPRGWGKKYGFD